VHAYLRGMRYLARFNPLRAIRDLRAYLASRQPYELYFMMAALAVTGIILVMFVHDSSFEREYKPNIIYVQQWRADRTDAQIIAQQKIDQVQRDKDDAAQAAREEKLRQSFKKVDDALTKYGI
jgi:hypothetical protein